MEPLLSLLLLLLLLLRCSLSLNYGLNGEKNDRWTDWNEQVRPRRTAGHGTWSALRVPVMVQQIPTSVEVKPGIIVIVGDPSGFPFENDMFIPANAYGSVEVWGDAVMTTSRLQKLPAHKRHCLFADETRILHRGYLRQNCIANCYQKFMQKNCKCCLDFIYYQISNESYYGSCNVQHLRCLAEYNNAFNNHLISESITVEKSEEHNPFCDCPDDCRNQKYVAKLIINDKAEKSNQVLADIHFERSFCTLYRSDIVFDFLDALVYYGSIAGLFLGASLLSLCHVLYVTILRIYYVVRDKTVYTKRMPINAEHVSYIQKELQPYKSRDSSSLWNIYIANNKLCVK